MGAFDHLIPKKKGGGVLGTLADLGKDALGGAVQGTGSGVRGVGEVADMDGVRQLGGALADLGGRLSRSTSQEYQRAKQGSTPSGELLSPSTWSLGDDPSLMGYAGQAANVLGQFAPTVAAAVLTKGKVAPTAAVGAAVGGGAAAEQEGERILDMEDADLAKIPRFQELTAGGMTQAQAREALAAETSSSAFRAAAPLGALSAFTEGLPLTGVGQRIMSKVAGDGRIARAVTGGVGGALGEGGQETLENAASIAGANLATGEERSLAEDSFANFALGALGGGIVSTAGGLLQTPDADPVATPEDFAPVAQPTPQATSPQAPIPNPSGPLSRAVNAGAATGLDVTPAPTTTPDPAAQRPAAQPDPAAQAQPPAPQPAVMQPAAEQPQAAQQPEPPRVPPGVDPLTGEVIGADEDRARNAIRVALETRRGIDGKLLAGAFPQIPPERLAQLVQDVRAERNQALKQQQPLAFPAPEQAKQSPEPAKPEQAPDLKLAPTGRPFKTDAAVQAALRFNPGMTAVKVEGGWALKPNSSDSSNSSFRNQGGVTPAAAETRSAMDAALKVGQHERTKFGFEPVGVNAAGQQVYQNSTGARQVRDANGNVIRTRFSPEAAKDAQYQTAEESTPAGGAQPANQQKEVIREEEQQVPTDVAGNVAGDAGQDGTQGQGEAQGPQALTQAAAPSAPQPAARQKALQRIERGTAYFASREKAEQFIADAGIGDTHEAVQVKPNRLEVRAKQPAAQQAAQDVAKVFRDAYLKAHGSDRALPDESYASAADMLSRMVEAKDADALISRNLGDAKANPAARAVFEALTGVKLPKGRGATERAIDEWAGVTPEERGRRTQARKDEIAERSAREQLPYLRRRAESVRVDGGEKQMNGAEWVDSVIAGGYSNVVMRGPVTYLANAEGRAYKVPNAAMAQYAREAVKRAKQDAPTQQPAQDQGGTAPQGAGSTQPTPAPAATPQPSANTVFTEDAAAAARARLKAAFSRLNSGIDPQMMLDGITLAGYHIEKGARSFAAYAKAMVEDLGDAVKPYLKSWYMAVKLDPRAAGFDGMDSLADVEAAPLPGERRADAETRARVDALPAGERDAEIERLRRQNEELQRQVDTDPLTGVASRAAYERDKPAAKGVAVIDLKLFKGYNTVGGQTFGDEVLRAFGAAMRDAEAQGVRAYRSGGDEFTFLSTTDVPAVEAATARLQENAQQISLQLTKDGVSYVVEGIPFTAGFGTDEKSADANLSSRKGDYDRNDLPESIRRVDSAAVPAGGEAAPAGGETGGGGVQGEASQVEGETNDRTRRNRSGNRTAAARGGAQERPAAAGDNDPAVGVDGREPREAEATGAEQGADASPAGTPGEPGGRGGRDGVDGERDGGRGPADGRDPASTVSSRQNFTITDELDFAGAGEVTKYRNNVAAIRLLKQIEGEGRTATAAEQSVLARYVGWGGLPMAFDPANAKWSERYAELKELLTPQEWAEAARSTQDAHYTSKEVVDGMWAMVARLGFDGGRVLEPSMGTGNFFGLMPPALRGASRLTGIELDSITGRIAKQLYPRASITVKGFNDTRIQPDSVDLAIGNPPFGQQSVFDPQYPEESKQSIHNYFFMKSLASLRPGGIMPMVVSNFMMDAQTSTTRAWLAERARLVAAFRLPNTAFKSNAGTSVTTDIIILQRLAPGEQGNPEAWVETGTFERDGQAYPLNRWFIDHPEALLGTLDVSTNTTYGRPGLILKPKPDTTLAQELERAVAMLPEGIYVPAGKSVMDAIAEGEVPAEAANARVYGHFVAPDGRIMQRQPDYNGKVTATTLNMEGTTADRLRGMMGIRDTVRALIRAETDPGASEAQLSALRDELNKAYDAFVKKHGYLSRDVNKRLFREDPDGPLLLGLEKDYDRGVSREVAKKSGVEPRKESAAKADIFTKRTNYPVRPTESVKDAKSAMLASLNERGRIDMDFVRRVYKKGRYLTEEDFAAELGDLVFNDMGELVPADAYLSGNVKAKLAAAIELAKKDPRYQRNVEALRRVQPPDKNPVDIFVRLGTPWIPMEDYAAFARDTFEGRADGAFLRAIGRWEVRIDSTNRTLSSERWGTDRMTASSIMEALMSNKPIAVYDPGERGTRILNQEATSAAKGKAAELEQEFAEWVWRDPERRERLARYFNDTFNTDVARKFDGSHMTFPGMNRSVLDGGALRPHQSAYVYRAIQDGRALADHVVGAGKTYAAIATVMEMRRLGISRKPMVVVPNHLVDQWAKDFVKLYPGANILAASRKDFQKGNRQRLFSRIATGDWDAVIVAHSSFGFIPLPPEQEQRILEDQVAEIQSAMEIIRRDKGKDKLSVKQLQKQKEALEEKLARLAKRPRDQIMDFSEMGVDSLTVDEAHEFKNLFFATSLRGVAGLGDPAGSKKAFDLFVKTRYLMERNGDKGVFFLTGTPVSNTLSEVFHMQRYLQFDQLKERGLHTFDAWAGTFGAIVSDWEMDAAGRFKEKSRFSKFANMKQLTQIWGQVADVVTRQDLMRDAEAQGKRFPLPKIKGGKPENVVAQRSPLQAAFIGTPIPRMDANGNPVVDPETGVPVEDYAPGTIIHRMDNMPKDPSVDNHLKATNDARKAGLDFRLIDPAAPDFAGSKVNEAARRIVDVWKRNDYRKGTQLVFCDLSVPASARGKATEKAQAKMPTFFTRIHGVLTHVDGKPVKLSAMPGGKFFLLKQGREWGVYEANTGLRIASGTSRQDVIDDANAAVASNLATIDATIQSRAIPQEDIEAYIRQWQEDQAQQQEPEGDGEDDAETQEDSVSMDELLADESTFSVYDDMKAKLIAAGIPEDQIAFIHDYETDLQKAALFAKVNRGDIRVLMGSTKKMGAGMNVQRKLVALHHLDAPWRPSDLEQRDGRIIRQGNEFYNEDPEGFEIELYRYSTGQTYDARQWEIIEVKARGIEDFRSGQKDEIEDVTGEAASAADMKGAASGNPLILESVKLRKEVKDLEAQERQHRSAAYAMERKVREIDDGTAYEFRALDRARSIAAAIGPADPFSVVLDGKTYTEKSEIKTTPIMEAFKKALGSPDPVRIGSYRGMDISVRKIGDSLRIAAEVGKEEVGATSFLPDDNLTVSGFFQRLDNIAKKGLEDGVRYAEASLEKAKREAEQARKELTRGFPKADELARKRARQAAVVNALRSGRRSVDGDPGAEAPATVSAAQMVDKDRNAVTVVRGPYMQGSARLALVKYPDGTQHEVLWSTLNAAPQFSKASKPARSMRPEVLQATYNRITKDWGVPVRVVATAAELPASVRRAPDFDQETVDGVIADGTIYIVADMIATPRQALTVLAHEAYGHFGMEAMLGNQFERVVRDVEKLRADGRMAELFAEIERRYPGADGATVAREAIAVLAERQERVPFLTRVIAALRRFLRGLGFNVDFTEGELRSMIARASRFVQAGGVGVNPDARIQFSRRLPGVEAVASVVDDKAADLRPTWLKALTRQQLVAVGRDQFDVGGENLAARYERLARRMEADAQQELAAPIGEGRRNVTEVTEAWAKMLFPLGRGRAMGAKLANLMHDATLAGIDPSEPPGRDDSAVEYARLKARWKELSPEAQQLYRDVRDAYAKRRKDFYDALVDRIERSDADGLVKRRMIDQLREQFEAGKVKGPYFPLARFGDYYVVAENADGEREFVMTETQRDQRREAARLRGLGYTVKAGKSMRNLAADMGPGAGFVAEVAALIDKEVGEDAAETLKDGLYQMYLQALPEQSVRKHFIHRKGTPGFSQDALRAFANQMGHGAKQLSRLRYASQLADTLRAMRKAAPDAPDPNKAADIVQALDSSYKWMMNPQNAAWANWATSLGFAWYLGVSPAAALVNLTQIPAVTLPVLSAKHGVAKSAAALAKASADYVGTLSKAKREKLEGEFNGDMGRMLTELETSGAIDRTMTLSMMGLGEDNAPVAIGAQRVMKTIGYLFHQAERMNREATAIAAYRLARDAGQGHDAAMEYAYETVFESHFDYSSSNRAEFMRGNMAKVLLLFRQYAQNITYYLARNLHQSLRGESKEVRQAAAVKLYGMLGMTTVFAGVLGLPVVGMAMSVARILQGMFGDDDEPFEPEAEFRRWLASMVGEDAGRIIARGAANELTGLDIASRTGLRDLWVRSPDPQQEGKDLAYHYLEQVAGPVAGIAINAFKGAQLVGEGQLRRGVESMVPKFVKDASKALRFREEGATTLRGDPIVEDFSGWELWNQGFGLTPANLSDQYSRNNMLKSAEQHVLDRRASLVNLWAMARKNGDADGIREAMALIQKFNRRWPQKAITPDTLRRSLMSREAFSRRTVGGVAIDEKLRPQLAPMVDY